MSIYACSILVDIILILFLILYPSIRSIKLDQEWSLESCFSIYLFNIRSKNIFEDPDRALDRELVVCPHLHQDVKQAGPGVWPVPVSNT